jgi:hypothetical protein
MELEKIIVAWSGGIEASFMAVQGYGWGQGLADAKAAVSLSSYSSSAVLTPQVGVW